MDTTTANRFGIEIETVGLSRGDIARAIHSVVGGSVNPYDYKVTMVDGRVWSVVHDGSLSGYENGEVVSPILTYPDMDMLQNVVRAVRAAGARVDASCGIHIHVDGSRFDARGLLNLVNIVHKNERLIERALGVSARRLESYTKPIRPDFIERLSARCARSLDELRAAWYNDASYRGSRYNETRYHGLNLNSLFYRGTVEFRYFNGTLHAGEVKSYVQFCLAIVQRAQSIKGSSRARRQVAQQNEKWAFRLFLKTLGLVGPEFKTARLHLSKLLEGNGANPGRANRRAAPQATAVV